MSAVYTLGIDVGSTASKCIILKDGKEIVAKSLIDVGAGTSGPQRAIDAVLEDCVQQYRSLGMTFDEIDGHLQAITKAMRSEARSAAEEREEYYGVE